MKQDPFLPLLPELYTQLRSSKWGEWLHFTNYDAFPQFQAALCEGNCTALPGRSCGRMEKHSPFTSVWPSSAFTLSFPLRPALIKWAIKCKNCFEKRSLVLSSSFFMRHSLGGEKKKPYQLNTEDALWSYRASSNGSMSAVCHTRGFFPTEGVLPKMAAQAFLPALSRLTALPDRTGQQSNGHSQRSLGRVTVIKALGCCAAPRAPRPGSSWALPADFQQAGAGPGSWEPALGSGPAVAPRSPRRSLPAPLQAAPAAVQHGAILGLVLTAAMGDILGGEDGQRSSAAAAILCLITAHSMGLQT